MFRKHINIFVLLFLSAFASFAQAEYTLRPEVPAFGLTDGVVGCDLTEDGLVVGFSQSMPSPFNGIAQRGEACLPLLASFPPPYPAALGFVQPNSTSVDDTVLIGADNMVWVVHGPQAPDAVIGCTLNGDGVLETTLIANGNGGAALGDPCFITLAAFAAQGRDVRGPVTATLGATNEGTGGGVAWFSHGPGYVGVILCDVDASTGKLVVTFRENSREGVVESSNGQSCLGIIAEDVEGENNFTGPMPVPRSGTDTSDPGCLIWDVVSGTIGQQGQ